MHPDSCANVEQAINDTNHDNPQTVAEPRLNELDWVAPRLKDIADLVDNLTRLSVNKVELILGDDTDKQPNDIITEINPPTLAASIDRTLAKIERDIRKATSALERL